MLLNPTPPDLSDAKVVELDFGASFTDFAEWTVTDAQVTAGSHVRVWLSAEPPTGRDGDEAEMEPMNCFAKDIIDGQFTLTAETHCGPVDGPYKFNYLIGW